MATVPIEDLHTPLLPDALAHNQRTFSNILSLSSLLLGSIAGTLGLESYSGFAFYILGSIVVSFMVVGVLAKGNTQLFGKSVVGSVVEECVSGAMGYVLAWTLVFGLVRA